MMEPGKFNLAVYILSMLVMDELDSFDEEFRNDPAKRRLVTDVDMKYSNDLAWCRNQYDEDECARVCKAADEYIDAQFCPILVH